jgi:serine/threonine-protein kinase
VAGRYTSIYDFAFGSLTQFTVDGGAHSPIWSPDGRRLAFTAEAANTDAEDLFAQPVDKSAPPLQLVRLPTDQHATSWPTDTMLVFSSQSAPVTLGTRNAFAGRGPVPNVSIVNPSAPGKSRAYLQADWTQSETAVSPDGTLAAFTSTESGSEEIMVRRFPVADSGGQWKVSSAGGRRPRWSGDGRTIFYQTLDGKVIKAVHVTTGSGFAVGSAETLLSTSGLGTAWDVDWRTGKMVFAEPIGDNAPRIIVIQNWLANFMRGRK